MWALGCVLYELITLEAAFPATSLTDLWSMIRNGAYCAITRCVALASANLEHGHARHLPAGTGALTVVSIL
jgi:serine/threonine protein kinase